MIHPIIIATPHHNQIASFTNIKLFSLINTRAKTNHMGDTISAPLSMNELTTEY